MNKVTFAILFSCVYFFEFLIMLLTGHDAVTWTLFLLSPLVVIYMVYTVIRYGVYSGNELKDDEEWGYEDVDKEKLGIW